MYILHDNQLSGGYYLGKKYIYQGDKYPCMSNSKEDAYTYKSEKVAQRVANNLNTKMDCAYEFQVEEI